MNERTDDEVAVVVAHELAHHVNGDLWRGALVDAGVIVAALGAANLAVAALASRLGLAGAADLAALPLIALVAGAMWIAATPARHALSRRDERRADTYALAITGSAAAFEAAIRRLGERHLAEERPTTITRWLYHRHPSVADRLALAEAFRRVKNI